MHPEKPKLEGSLPGFVARGFVRTRSNPEPFDVPLHCDTVWFFPSVEQVALIWRGVFPIATDDELEVTEILVGLERIGEPKPKEHYDDVRRKRADKKRGDVHKLRDSDLLPSGVKVILPKDAKVDKALEHEDAFGQNMRRRAQAELTTARERVKAMGGDEYLKLPESLPPREEMKVDDLETFLDGIDRKVDEMMKDAAFHRKDAM